MNPFVERARALAGTLPAHTEAHERERRLSPEVEGALRDGGFLQVLLPRELGGHELAVTDYLEVLEALAAGDASTAWVVMTASTSALVGAYLDRAVAQRIWPAGAPATFMAGVFAPTGKLVAGSLTGRWAYTSGSRHADWFAVGALEMPDGGGKPRHVVCFLPRGAPGATVVDNWDTLGLGGTGSHDLVVEGAAVPAELAVSVFERAPWPEAPLFRLPLFGLLAVGISAVGLGISRTAMTALVARVTAEKGDRPGDPPPSTVLAAYARCSARLGAARAYLLDVTGRAHAAAGAGAVTPAVRGELRLAASHVAAECNAVVRDAFHLGGGPGIRAGNPLGRALRDVETLLTHKMVADRVLPATARALLGVGTVPPDL